MYDQYFHLLDKKTGEKLKNIPYSIARPSAGLEQRGLTTDKGKSILTHIHTGESADNLEIHYTGDEDINHGW
jgi:hypothetical protein